MNDNSFTLWPIRMQLAIAIAITAGVLLPNHEIQIDSATIPLRMLCAFLLAVIPTWFALKGGRFIPIWNAPTSTFMVSMKRFERAFLLIWSVSIGTALGMFRWDLCVESVLPDPLCDSALLCQFVIQTPVFVSVIFYWWSVATAEEKHVQFLSGVDVIELPQRECMATVWMQIRQMILVPALPVVAILSIDDVLNLTSIASSYRVVFFGAIVMAMPFALPLLLRRLWNLESLADGATRHRIESMIGRVNVDIADVCLWRTGNRCMNAAVAGAHKTSRILLVSDALIDTLDDSHLDAVVAHEMAHIKHRHVPTMLFSLFAAGLFAVMCTQIIDRASIGVANGGSISLLILVAVLGVWLVVHRYIARSFEHHADLVACGHLPVPTGVDRIAAAPTKTTDSAVYTFASMLKRLAPSGSTGSDWWHPSIETRIEVLRQLHRDSRKRARFDERIATIKRSVRCSVVFLLLVTSGLALISL